MEIFLAALLKCSVAMSVISLVYMGVMPFLSKRYSAKWLYYVWLVVAVGWAVPVRPCFDKVLFSFRIPEVQIVQAKGIDMITPLTIITHKVSKTSSIPLWQIAAFIWLICAIGIIAYNVRRHKRFLKLVERWSEDITDSQTLDVLADLKEKMKVNAAVGLKKCPCIISPMLVGFFRPVVLLPYGQIPLDELTFVLRHELIHLKRKDLWYKALVLTATALHWFNPLVHIMAKAVAVQCEISCDELLVREINFQQRKQYGEILIGAVRKETGFQTALSTNFYREGHFIKTRIFRIMDATKKKAGISILCAALILIIGSEMIFASSPAQNQKDVFDDKSKNVRIVNIDVKTLDRGKSACLKGIHTLEGGDILRYKIAADGNGENLAIKLLREATKAANGEAGFQELMIIHTPLNSSVQQVEIKESQAGSYCLLIGNNNAEPLRNIKGTIEIIKKGE